MRDFDKLKLGCWFNFRLRSVFAIDLASSPITLLNSKVAKSETLLLQKLCPNPLQNPQDTTYTGVSFETNQWSKELNVMWHPWSRTIFQTNGGTFRPLMIIW